MRKAKIALSAIAIFAVVGGAFAFNAARSTSRFFTLNAAGNCRQAVNLPYTTNFNDATAPIPVTVTLTATTIAANGACPTIPVYSFD